MAKIRYNLKNAHYAVMTEAQDGTISYGTPVALPGAVSLDLSQEGEEVREYADGVVWWAGAVNSGYTGDFEMEVIPQSFKTAVLGEILNNNMLLEDADATGKKFAFLFQIDTDDKPLLFCFYNCTCTRPSIGSQTKEDTIEAQHETLSITAVSANINDMNIVKAASTDETTDEQRAAWFTAVPMPTSGSNTEG